MNHIYKDNYEEMTSYFLLKNFESEEFEQYYKTMEGYKAEFYIKNFTYLFNKNKKICDFACGIGRLINFHLVNKNNHLTLVDINKEFLLLCEKILKRKKYKNYKIVNQNLLNLNLDDRYDISFCTGFLNYLEIDEQKKIIGKISQITNEFVVIELIRKYSIVNTYYNLSSNKIIKKFLRSILNIFENNNIRNIKNINNFFLKLRFLIFQLSSDNTSFPNNVYAEKIYKEIFKELGFTIHDNKNYKSLKVLVFKKL